ncbi:MAG: Panacea domain-containing protein [Lachnospiraceae bacterium]
MIKHFIILSSSYSDGKRIAVHYILDEQVTAEMISNEIKTIKEQCGQNVSISTHCVVTDSTDWASIVEKDSFFEDVEVIESLGGFINFIRQDLTLQGIDIAKYVLSKVECTHLSLEKLVYMCYADYLYYTGKKLFSDKIYAFKYGPVVDTVYKTFRKQRELQCAVENMSSARSRILFAENGMEKLQQIEATLERFGSFSAGKLVEITHVKNGPWDSVDHDSTYTEIPDQIILEKHQLELNYARV